MILSKCIVDAVMASYSEKNRIIALIVDTTTNLLIFYFSLIITMTPIYLWENKWNYKWKACNGRFVMQRIQKHNPLQKKNFVFQLIYKKKHFIFAKFALCLDSTTKGKTICRWNTSTKTPRSIFNQILSQSINICQATHSHI